MSAALQLPTPTPEPDPPRAGADMPRRLGRVLNLVRKLIDYGKQLAATVQQRAGTPGFAFLVRPFGTADLAVILARITCGLRRAAMLEAKLCKRAERGRDLTVPPIRLPAIRVPGAAREAAPRDVQPADPARTRVSPACPPRKKSPRRCVAARSAPSSSISAAISASRLGRLDRAFWDEINHALMVYGGSLRPLLQRPGEAARAPPLRRPSDQPDPGCARGTSAIAGTHHRPALKPTPESRPPPGLTDAADAPFVAQAACQRTWSMHNLGCHQLGEPQGGPTARQHPRRYRRLDVRTVARVVLSVRPAAEARTGIRQPPADLDRGQRHLLWRAEAGELHSLAGGNA